MHEPLRALRSTNQTRAARASPAPEKAVPDLVAEQERARLEKRKQHEQELTSRRTAYEAREADLRALRETDIPAATAELAERGGPIPQQALGPCTPQENRAVGEGRARQGRAFRARHLTEEYYAIDREAQKGREGPTDQRHRSRHR